MGIGNALRLWTGAGAAAAVPSDRVTPEPQVTAWTTSSLSTVPWPDILGADELPASRAVAMSVPALARGVQLLKTTIAKWPPVDMLGDVPAPIQPPWTVRTSTPPYSWQLRNAYTVDDLVFFGVSLWRARRGEDGFPLEYGHVPYDQWEVNTAREIVDLDGRPFPPREVTLIVGWHEGILTFGARAIRQAIALEAAAMETARAPFKLELHQTTDVELTEAEKAALVAEARRAMAETGGILFTNSAVQAIAHGGAAEALFTEARNASAVDMARLLGVPAASIDATSAGTSLTYETVAGRNQQFLDYATSLYADPIAARLSQDDVVPRGHRVALDTTASTELNPAATGPAVED